MRIAIVYDNRLSYTTGNYFRDAFARIAETRHFHPSQMHLIKKEDYDLFIKIDDGMPTNGWRVDLHPSVYYCIDSHIEAEGGWRRTLLQRAGFDYVFCAQKTGAEMFADLAPVVQWVPLGCSPTQHSIMGTEWKPFQKQYDVCFIGNFHSQYATGRIEYCGALFKEFPNFFYGRRSFLEMAKKMAWSRIAFNHSLNNDVNMRNFEACASGSFQLTTRIKDNGMEELFTEGEHYAGYGSVAEMLEKARYYLANPEEREKIAKAGWEHAVKNHTYDHRAGEILQTIERRK